LNDRFAEPLQATSKKVEQRGERNTIDRDHIPAGRGVYGIEWQPATFNE
jgi:hypothetical protein